ncbi:MAG: pantothenate synthase [Stictis urceolatum]|nr:pantothenate synthase [Stictis urceolata]
MGALHDGHLNLVRAAAKECDEVFVSVYVNPAQFGANEDLSSYPQTFEKDLAELQRLNTEFQNSAKDQFRGRVTQIFRPSTEAMYPVGLELGSYIAMNPTISQVLEGKSRPQFFQGVSTVVTKLLNIVQPDLVYLGQKDIQQLIVVQRMINEFHLPPQLRCIATRRHLDGLAMSSRNMYLGARRRAVATCLYKSLIAGYQRYLGHQMSREQILGETVNLAEGIRQNQMAKPSSQRVRFEIDYLSLADPTYLKEVDQVDENVGAILSGAMVMLPLEEPQPGEELGLGDDKRPVRLIDNFLLGAARDIGSNQA